MIVNAITRTLCAAFGAAACLIASGEGASAATVTESGTVGFGSGFTITLPRFDPALGTLTGVEIAAEGTATTWVVELAFTSCLQFSDGNGLCMSETATAINTGATLSVSGPGILASATGPATIGTCTTEPFEGDVCFADAESIATLDASASPTDFVPFVGAGDVTFTFGLPEPETLLGGEGSVALTYSYAPAQVPVPAAGLLLIGGLAGLGALRLRRTARG
jgi:hypothetical protein